MNLDWTVIKDKALETFSRVSMLAVFLAGCFYFLGCIVTATPLGPRGYVDFTYYVFQYRHGAHHPVTPTTTQKEITRGQPNH